MIKVTMIEGNCISTTEISTMTIDGVIDRFELSRDDLAAAKADNFMDSAEQVTETITELLHIITVYDSDGEATFIIKAIEPT